MRRLLLLAWEKGDPELMVCRVTSARLHLQPRKRFQAGGKKKNRLTILIGEDPKNILVVEENGDKAARTKATDLESLLYAEKPMEVDWRKKLKVLPRAVRPHDHHWPGADRTADAPRLAVGKRAGGRWDREDPVDTHLQAARRHVDEGSGLRAARRVP